jgi:hypothetical protein
MTYATPKPTPTAATSLSAVSTAISPTTPAIAIDTSTTSMPMSRCEKV